MTNPRNARDIDYGGFSSVDSLVEFLMFGDIIYFAKSLTILWIRDIRRTCAAGNNDGSDT